MNKELNLKIEDLFRWKGKLDITDNEGNVVETLYQRVIGDSDIQKARVEGLKASKQLRKALRDKESDEYLAHVPLEGDFTKEELIAIIIFSKYLLFRTQAEMRVREEKVKEPKGDATLEDQEKYIEELETVRKTYEEKLNEDIKKQGEKLEQELTAKSYEEVFEIYLKEQIELLCRQKMMQTFNDYAVFFGTFSDEAMKQRRFEAVDDFRNLSTNIKRKLEDNYRNLELNIEDVKK